MNIIQGRPWELTLILVVTVFLFLPSLSQSFVSWDDEGHLTENRFVRSLSVDNLKSIFQSDVNKTYIPLTVLSFALEYHFFGYNPLFYHLNNLLLHLGVVVLVYVLTLRLGFQSQIACLAALLFAIHPMHVESVVWVTQRKDVLYSFFYMLALWQYVVYVKDKRAGSYFRSVLFGLLSILAKPMALSLPLIVCLVDWYLKRPLSRQLFVEKLVFALTIFPVAWLTYAMNMRAVDFQFPLSILIWAWCFIFYLLKFLWPAELLVLYQLPQPMVAHHSEYIVAGVLFVLLIVALIRFKHDRLLIFAVGYFALSIFFLLRFDQKQDLTIVSDRFMYLPSLGICILTGWWVIRILEWSQKSKREIGRFVKGIVVLIIFVLGVLTYGRVQMWSDERALWGQVVRKYDNGLAYTQLGNHFLKKGDLTEALKNYEVAITKLPTYSKPYSNRGIVLLKMGQYEQAIRDFNRAIELDKIPSAVTFTNRGYVFMLIGQYAEAKSDYDLAIAIDPFYVPAFLNRATLHKNRQDYSSAMNDLKRVLAIDPKNAVALNNIRILEGLIHQPEMR